MDFKKVGRINYSKEKYFEDEYERMPVCCVHCQASSDDDSDWGAMPISIAEGFAIGFAGPSFIEGWNHSSAFQQLLKMVLDLSQLLC